MSYWQLYLPATGLNLLSNPSLELTTTGYGPVDSAVLERDNTYAAVGGWSLKVTPDAGQISSGAKFDLALTAMTWHVFSVYVLGVAGATYNVVITETDGGAAVVLDEFIGTGAWQRIEAPFEAQIAVSSYRFAVKRVALYTTDPFWLDAWQVELDLLDSEATAVASTYIDGDQPGCLWNGARHLSTSTRSAQWRGGGRIVDFDAYGAYVTDHQGTGSATYENVATDNGIIGGATYQRSIVRARSFALSVWFEATSQDDLHAKRQALLDALKPNLVSPQQPVVLRYTGAGSPRIMYGHYEDGLDSGSIWPNGADVSIRFIAFDPYWYDEIGSSKLLSAFDEVTDADYIVERQSNGAWHALAGGLNGTVRAAIYGADGNLYVAGEFTIAYNAAGAGSPITVNCVARWDGSSWAALGSGFNGIVYALALAPDGTLYAGGEFTNAGYLYLAKWNGSTWSAVGSAGAGTGIVYTLAYNAAVGRLYIGGTFSSWNADVNQSGITSWDGGAYAPLGSGTNVSIFFVGVLALALEANGNVIAAGSFSTVNGTAINRVARWNPYTSDWSGMDALFDQGILSVAVDRSGLIFVGGTFVTPASMPYLAVYNGSSWNAVGGGVSGAVWSIHVSEDGLLVISGEFTAAGGSALRDRTALWNGSAWVSSWIDLPGSAVVSAIAHNVYTNELTLGYNTSGTAVASNIVDTDVYNPGTEDSAPLISMSDAMTVDAIINWTTGKALYFANLMIQPGETVFLDLAVLTPQYMPTLLVSPYGRNGPRLWSTFRGDITRLVLPHSDLASFRLLPGLNTILIKTRDALAGAKVLLAWKNRFLSNDH